MLQNYNFLLLLYQVTLVPLAQAPRHHNVVIEEDTGVRQVLPGLGHLPRLPPPDIISRFKELISYELLLPRVPNN